MPAPMDCQHPMTVTPPAPGSNARVALLDTGHQAFMARLALVESARCTVDAQYYIWNSDLSGRYLAARLYAAAERGVRVRVLLDDINVAGRDSSLAALAAHPNVELQVYNPFGSRGATRSLGFISEFARLNRRMHNKSFTVDGVITVLGGRNIGDEYFDSAEELNFRDRDVLVSGEPASSTQQMFDNFWASALARPIESLVEEPVTPVDADVLAGIESEVRPALTSIHGALPLGFDAGAAALAVFSDEMLSVSARLIHDLPPDPDKVADTDEPQPSAIALSEVSQQARSEVLIESAYLVLDDETLANVTALRHGSVRVRALTNSLASNDVTANHAAYAGRRQQMLEAGIELHEWRPDARSCRQLVENPAACSKHHIFGLHAKTFVFDRKVVYIGSLNLNLRSRYLNAESGLVIESPELAARVADDIELNMRAENSWAVGLDEQGDVVWWEDAANHDAGQWQHEPTVPWSRRMASWFISILGMEKYL